MEKLLLFDIDGTLLHTKGAGRYALIESTYQVLGSPSSYDREQLMKTFSPSGKTDKECFRELIGNRVSSGLLDEKIDAAAKLYLLLLEKNIMRFSVAPCDGVVEILNILSAQSNVTLGLVTGNLRKGAEIKLRAANLDSFFNFQLGAFGEDGYEKWTIASAAVQKISALSNRTFNPEQIIMIGDSPADVAGGKHWGYKTLAVATGSHSKEELEHTNPDYCISNFTNWADIEYIFQ